MKITDRDIKIMNWIEKFQGATIEQIAKLYFPSYDMAKKRLKILKDNNFIKVAKHPILNKNVYYNKNVPSYHTLICNSILIYAKEELIKFEREYQIGKYKVDALAVTRDKKVIVFEVDIFNKTSITKADNVAKQLKDKLGVQPRMIVVSREKRRKKGFWEEVEIERIEKIQEVIKNI